MNKYTVIGSSYFFFKIFSFFGSVQILQSPQQKLIPNYPDPQRRIHSANLGMLVLIPYTDLNCQRIVTKTWIIDEPYLGI